MISSDLEKQFEGCRLVAYPDPGTGGEPWTIGYGHTRGVKEGDTCTQDQAEAWLIDDMQTAIRAVEASVAVPLTDNEKSAVVDFVYNLGQGNFKSSTLLKLLNKGDFVGAANEFKRWNKANGKVLDGLTNRRLAETKLFKKDKGIA